MARISKRLLKLHEQAETLLENDILTADQRHFVLDNFQESIYSDQSKSATFFTPRTMASEFILNTFGFIHTDKTIKVIDLCAGIGSLSRALIDYFGSSAKFDITCIEINSNNVDVGKKVVPEAKWIQGDVLDLDLILSLGQFDFAISNPPFGKVPTVSGKPSFNYTGGEAEFKVLDIASVIANHVGFIVPQGSAGFKYSGQRQYTIDKTAKFSKFVEQTGIEVGHGIPIDTSAPGIDSFRNTNITVEFIEAETDTIRADLINHANAQQSIF